MSINRKISRIIYTIFIVIQVILLIFLYTKNPIYVSMTNYAALFRNSIAIILVLFTITIVCNIFEHKKINKNQGILDENMINANFDLSLRNYDILYLSTILKKQYPTKKSIILIIMQLINKKVIDLSCYYDGNSYQYIIEKRTSYYTNLNDIEIKLLNYLFRNSSRVNLLNELQTIYSRKNKTVLSFIQKCHKYMQKFKVEENSMFLSLYKKLSILSAITMLFLGFCILILCLSTIDTSILNNIFVNIVKIILIVLSLIFIAFLYTLLLKKFNNKYTYDNDSYIWLCKNLILIFAGFIISYFLPYSYIVQFITFTIYLFTTFTILIRYNKHISLSSNDVKLVEKLISLKNFFKNMDYLKNKEFANIITYEECLMYGFLFNLTIKLNNEFDLLQKELFEVISNEGNLYFKLFNDDIL